MRTEEKCRLIVDAILEKKGHRIVTIDLTGIDHAICDSVVICHGESTTQVGAITESIMKKLKEKVSIQPHHVEGLQNSQWVLIDYFDVLVHIFLEEFRNFYKLEELWADGKVKWTEEKG
jgi:ribosome-associated protein